MSEHMKDTEEELVFEAFVNAARPEPHHQREAIAAALRAAADQVVPDERSDGVYLQGNDYQRWLERKLIRRHLLRIADRLIPRNHPLYFEND